MNCPTSWWHIFTGLIDNSSVTNSPTSDGGNPPTDNREGGCDDSALHKKIGTGRDDGRPGMGTRGPGMGGPGLGGPSK